MFFCPPSVASGSPLSPPASRPSARSPASFKAFLSWARPELGLPALVPSCPAPPLPEAPSSSCARKELSSCASHLPDPGSAEPGITDPGSADAAGSQAALSGLSAPRPRGAAEGARGSWSLASSASASPCGMSHLPSASFVFLDGQPRVSARAPSSLRKGLGNALLAGPAFPSTSLVSRNALSPAWVRPPGLSCRSRR